MVTYWDSSRRPLYVRTIWKDGQHHVILDKTKEDQLDISGALRSAKQRSNSQSSHRTTKSASAGVSLKVSSVRILLSGIRRLKYSHKESRFIRDKSIERPKTWTQPTLSRSVTYKDLNKEVTFNAIQGIRATNLHKSSTLDSELDELHTSESYRSNLVSNNALSERVMIWLDLAIHSDREIKRDCAVTAQACRINSKSEKQPKYDKAVDNIADSSILKNTSPRADEKTRERNIILYSNEEIGTPQENFYQVLSPTITNEDSYREELIKPKNNTKTKRQLHIFMPNLPKKSSDCDCDSSVLSSVISVN